MKENKTVGRPPAGESKFTTVLVCVTKEENQKITKEWEEYKAKNNLPTLSKSAFLRPRLLGKSAK